MQREKGVIHWWSRARGYGYILSDTNNKRYLAHYGELPRHLSSLPAGTKVTFTLIRTNKGAMLAQKIKLLGEDGHEIE
jgi:cold shock CspA family protein